MISWSSACDTHPGNCLENNEDAVLSLSGSAFWLVADGMGGHQDGDYASEAIVQSLAEVTLTGDLSDCVDAVEDRLLDVNDHLRHHARIQCEGRTLGSTVVLMLARDNVGVALWAGDSRLYRVRNRQIELITRDHNPISDMLDTCWVTETEALAADTHIVTRAVGGQRELHLDVAVFEIEPGDTMLLCSDGLYREVSEESLIDALQKEVPDAVEDLMIRCLDGVASDNVSMVVTRAQL